jgi:HD superfamily phosphohydrolase
MELEEAMKFLEDYLDKEDRKFVSEYRLMFLESIDRLIKYIKEESIPRAVVEEAIIDWDKNIKWANADDHYYAIKILQEILNKGE